MKSKEADRKHNWCITGLLTVPIIFGLILIYSFNEINLLTWVIAGLGAFLTMELVFLTWIYEFVNDKDKINVVVTKLGSGFTGAFLMGIGISIAFWIRDYIIPNFTKILIACFLL